MDGFYSDLYISIVGEERYLFDFYWVVFFFYVCKHLYV